MGCRSPDRNVDRLARAMLRGESSPGEKSSANGHRIAQNTAKLVASLRRWPAPVQPCGLDEACPLARLARQELAVLLVLFRTDLAFGQALLEGVKRGWPVMTR